MTKVIKQLHKVTAVARFESESPLKWMVFFIKLNRFVWQTSPKVRKCNHIKILPGFLKWDILSPLSSWCLKKAINFQEKWMYCPQLWVKMCFDISNLNGRPGMAVRIPNSFQHMLNRIYMMRCTNTDVSICFVFIMAAKVQNFVEKDHKFCSDDCNFGVKVTKVRLSAAVWSHDLCYVTMGLIMWPDYRPGVYFINCHYEKVNLYHKSVNLLTETEMYVFYGMGEEGTLLKIQSVLENTCSLW